MIKDSGERTEYETGAVRDMRKGKGRCDLLPLMECSRLLQNDEVIGNLDGYLANDNDENFLEDALYAFCNQVNWDVPTMLLELAVHFEEGAEKYGEHNWEKGLPKWCYLDSAIRHYLKYLRGDVDERHDRAFCWNIMCLMWTIRNSPKSAKED